MPWLCHNRIVRLTLADKDGSVRQRAQLRGKRDWGKSENRRYTHIVCSWILFQLI